MCSVTPAAGSIPGNNHGNGLTNKYIQKEGPRARLEQVRQAHKADCTKDTVKTGVLECQTMGCGQAPWRQPPEHEMPQHSEVKRQSCRRKTRQQQLQRIRHSEWLDQQSAQHKFRRCRGELAHVLQGSGNKAAYH